MASSFIVFVLLLMCFIVCTSANIGTYSDEGINPVAFNPVGGDLLGSVGIQHPYPAQQYPTEFNPLYTSLPSFVPSNFPPIGGNIYDNNQDFYPNQYNPVQFNPSYGVLSSSLPSNIAPFTNSDPNPIRFQAPYLHRPYPNYPVSQFVNLLPRSDPHIAQLQISQPTKNPIVYIESKISEPNTNPTKQLYITPSINSSQSSGHYPQNISPSHVETDIPKSIPIPARQIEIHPTPYPLTRTEQFINKPFNYYPQNIPSSNVAMNIPISAQYPEKQLDIRPIPYPLWYPDQQVNGQPLRNYPQNVQLPILVQSPEKQTEVTSNSYTHMSASNVNFPSDFHISYPQISSKDNPSRLFPRSQDYVIPQALNSYPLYVNAPVHSIMTDEGIVPVKMITVQNSKPEPGFILPAAVIGGQLYNNVPVKYVDVKKEDSAVKSEGITNNVNH
ncbi:hypothetical protein CBL_01729 [Carabus blaptoides fortunei]